MAVLRTGKHRHQISHQLRSLLREYDPAALAAFEPWRNGLRRGEAREICRDAATPTRAARLTRPQLQHNRTYDEAVAFPKGGAAAQTVAA